MSFKDFRVLETIGKGSFASVYKVIRKSDSKVYALKRVKINKMSKKEIADALNEIRFLASIRQKNIVGFLEAFLENNETELCIIMEYCGCGDLAQKVERYKRRRQYIDENVIWKYLVQCLKALEHLHEKKICHRDLKVANTFLAEDGSVKIGDMNVSKRLSHQGKLQTQIGTPYYMSPEIWNNRPYDAGSDLWSLGCMIYELASLRPPFVGDSFPSLKRAVTAGRYSPLPRKYSDSLTKVIGMMLRLNSRDRPSAHALLHSAELSSKLQFDADNVVPDSSRVDKMNMINTIKVPQNLRKLGGALPKPCYPDVRPNSPTAWTVEEQGKNERKKEREYEKMRPPMPPISDENENTPPIDYSRDESSSKVYSARERVEKQQQPSVSKQPPALSAIAEYYSRRPLAPVAPSVANKVEQKISHVPGAYNRGNRGGIYAQPSGHRAGNPSRQQNHRMW